MARRAIVDAIHLAEIRAGDMRCLTTGGAHAQVNLRLAEIDRLKLCVNIRDMDKRDIAVGVELKQVVLSQLLLGREARPIAKAGRTNHSRSRHRDLKKIATRDHRRGAFQSVYHTAYIRMCEFIKDNKGPPVISPRNGPLRF